MVVHVQSILSHFYHLRRIERPNNLVGHIHISVRHVYVTFSLWDKINHLQTARQTLKPHERCPTLILSMMRRDPFSSAFTGRRRTRGAVSEDAGSGGGSPAELCQGSDTIADARR